MNNILLTTDFTQDSSHSLDYVLDILKDSKFPVKILLLHTFMVQQTDPSKIIILNDEMKLKSKMGLEELRNEAMKKVTNPNISIEVASQMGSLKNVILQLLDTSKFDLVVMGKNGGKQIESVAALLKQRNCPILITHSEPITDQVFY